MIHNWKDRQELIAKARRIEQLGYQTLLVPDHLRGQFAPIAALATLAACTNHIRIGSLVLANDFRQPVMLAREAATLDVLSDGRFELGIGAGWRQGEYEQAGIPYDPAPVRINRMAEALDVIKGYFSGEPYSFSGEFYTVSNLTGFPHPLQPHIPLLAGGGGKRMLQIAASKADIVSLTLKSLPDGSGPDWADGSTEATTRKIGWIEEAAGERFGDLEINIMTNTIAVTDDRAAAAEKAAQWRKIPVNQVLDSPHAFIGTVEQICADLQRRREQFAISYIALPEMFAEPFAAVVAQMAGK